MESGSYAFRMNVPVKIENVDRPVNIPIDVVVMPRRAKKGQLPLFIEAKSAGDFTNVNKRRKEEATKVDSASEELRQRRAICSLLVRLLRFRLPWLRGCRRN